MNVNVETKERAKNAAERSDRRAQAPSLRLGAKRAHQYRSCGRLVHRTPRGGARTCFRERERPPRALWSRRWLVFRNTHRSCRSPAAKVLGAFNRSAMRERDLGPMRQPNVDFGTSRARTKTETRKRSLKGHGHGSSAWPFEVTRPRAAAHRPGAVPQSGQRFIVAGSSPHILAPGRRNTAPYLSIVADASETPYRERRSTSCQCLTAPPSRVTTASY